MIFAFYSWLNPFTTKMDMTLQNMTISAKTSQLERFLQTMRKKSPILTLEDAVKPGNFINVIEAVKERI